MTTDLALARRHFLAGGAALGAAALLPRRPAFAASADWRELTARPGKASLWEEGGPLADIWGYDGGVPGPVLRIPQGQTLKIRFRNRLEQPTTVHWHGIRIANAYDGVAGLTQDPVEPGAEFEYLVRAPDAGTYWYHPHNRSWDQLARGLYGVLIVEEPGEKAYDRDVVLAVDDWRLNDERQIDTASLGAMHDWAHAGRLGNVLTVNARPYLRESARPGERLRLRVLNTANARVLNLRFAGLAPRVIALDGQPVTPHLLEAETLRIAPAQRCDLIVDLPGGEQVFKIDEVSRDPFTACEIVVAGPAAERAAALPDDIALPANPVPKALEMRDALPVDLRMEGGAMGGMREAMLHGERKAMRDLFEAGKVWSFNGIAGSHHDAALFTVARGRTVSMPIVNDTRWPHAIHVHGHHFRVLSRNGEEVTREQWRDTVLMEPEERVEIAFVADNPGKWMIHCHMLEHQAAGMMAWFEVT